MPRSSCVSSPRRLHIAVASGQLYNSDSVYVLFNGATFAIQVQNADGSVTYGTLTATTKACSESPKTIPEQMLGGIASRESLNEVRDCLR